MRKGFMAGAACLLLTLLCAAASADTLDILKPLWLTALENNQESQSEPEVLTDPVIVSGDEQFEVVRSGVYMDDRYEPEMYVYAELRNTGESIVRLSGATMTVLDDADRQVSRREYVSVAPDVIMPGESAFVSEWMYDFTSSLSRVHTVEVAFEHWENGRKRIEPLADVKAYTQDGYLYAELTNTTDEVLYEAGVTALVLDPKGEILDIFSEQTYSSLGIAPGSTVVFRKYLEQHAVDAVESTCEARGYHYAE